MVDTQILLNPKHLKQTPITTNAQATPRNISERVSFNLNDAKADTNQDRSQHGEDDNSKKILIRENSDEQFLQDQKSPFVNINYQSRKNIKLKHSQGQFEASPMIIKSTPMIQSYKDVPKIKDMYKQFTLPTTKIQSVEPKESDSWLSRKSSNATILARK